MSRVASKRTAIPRRLRIRRALPFGAGLVLVVAIVALVARGAIERTFLERAFAGAIDGQASIGRLEHDANARILADVSLRSNNGGVLVTAARVALTDRGEGLDVVASGVRATVVAGLLRGDEGERFAALDGALGAGRLTFHLTGGAVRVARAAGTDPTLDLSGIVATLRRDGARTKYDVKFSITDASGTYPAGGHGVSDAGGRIVHTWTAEKLPAAALGTLLAPGPLTIVDGFARDVVLRSAPERLSLTLDGVGASIASHGLRALAGPLVVTADGIGTAGITGTIESVPIDVAGEVHDPRGWAHGLGAGTNDLHALQRLFELVAAQPRVKWMKFEMTAPGITFGQYAMTTKDIPHVISLLAFDPREPTLHFGTALASDRIISQGERTSDLGVRTKAVAGVNGDYFDIGRTYEPQGLLIHDGTLLHGPTDRYALTFDRQNKVRFAIFHLSGQVVDGETSYRVTQFNSWPAKYVSVITPDYGKLLPAAPGMMFAALEPLGATRYRVLSVEPAVAPIAVRLGLGFGRLSKGPLPRPGDVVDVTYAIDPPVDGAIAAVGSGPLLLKDGQWFEDKRAPAPDERDVQWPVVALGTLSDDTLLIAAVDGRHPERSIGMTRPEFADLLRGFGVLDAMALDSGGSVTMVSRAPGNAAVTVRNVPSDNSDERYVSDALFVYSSAPPGTIVTAPRATASMKPAR